MMNSGLRRLLSGAVALMLLGCSSALADTATVLPPPQRFYR